jgi:hypothetical protein
MEKPTTQLSTQDRVIFVLRAMQSMASCLPDVIAKIPTTGLTLARYHSSTISLLA